MAAQDETRTEMPPLTGYSPVRRRADAALGVGNPISRHKRARFGEHDTSIGRCITYSCPSLEETVPQVTLTDVNVPGDFTLLDSSATSLLSSATTVENQQAIISQLPDHVNSPSVKPQSHLTALQREAHLNQMALQKQLDQGKGTADAYPRHLKSYVHFWDADQERRVAEDPTHQKVPAHPIVGYKVSLFLEHETKRNKVSLSSYFVSL